MWKDFVRMKKKNMIISDDGAYLGAYLSEEKKKRTKKNKSTYIPPDRSCSSSAAPSIPGAERSSALSTEPNTQSSPYFIIPRFFFNGLYMDKSKSINLGRLNFWGGDGYTRVFFYDITGQTLVVRGCVPVHYVHMVYIRSTRWRWEMYIKKQTRKGGLKLWCE